MGKIKESLNKVPEKIAKTADTKFDLSINYKIFPDEFDSDLDSVLIRLRAGK